MWVVLFLAILVILVLAVFAIQGLVILVQQRSIDRLQARVPQHSSTVTDTCSVQTAKLKENKSTDKKEIEDEEAERYHDAQTQTEQNVPDISGEVEEWSHSYGSWDENSNVEVVGGRSIRGTYENARPEVTPTSDRLDRCLKAKKVPVEECAEAPNSQIHSQGSCYSDEQCSILGRKWQLVKWDPNAWQLVPVRAAEVRLDREQQQYDHPVVIWKLCVLVTPTGNVALALQVWTPDCTVIYRQVAYIYTGGRQTREWVRLTAFSSTDNDSIVNLHVCVPICREGRPQIGHNENICQDVPYVNELSRGCVYNYAGNRSIVIDTHVFNIRGTAENQLTSLSTPWKCAVVSTYQHVQTRRESRPHTVLQHHRHSRQMTPEYIVVGRQAVHGHRENRKFFQQIFVIKTTTERTDRNHIPMVTKHAITEHAIDMQNTDDVDSLEDLKNDEDNRLDKYKTVINAQNSLVIPKVRNDAEIYIQAGDNNSMESDKGYESGCSSLDSEQDEDQNDVCDLQTQNSCIVVERRDGTCIENDCVDLLDNDETSDTCSTGCDEEQNDVCDLQTQNSCIVIERRDGTCKENDCVDLLDNDETRDTCSTGCDDNTNANSENNTYANTDANTYANTDDNTRFNECTITEGGEVSGERKRAVLRTDSSPILLKVKEMGMTETWKRDVQPTISNDLVTDGNPKGDTLFGKTVAGKPKTKIQIVSEPDHHTCILRLFEQRPVGKNEPIFTTIEDNGQNSNLVLHDVNEDASINYQIGNDNSITSDYGSYDAESERDSIYSSLESESGYGSMGSSDDSFESGSAYSINGNERTYNVSQTTSPEVPTDIMMTIAPMSSTHIHICSRTNTTANKGAIYIQIGENNTLRVLDLGEWAVQKFHVCSLRQVTRIPEKLYFNCVYRVYASEQIWETILQMMPTLQCAGTSNQHDRSPVLVGLDKHLNPRNIHFKDELPIGPPNQPLSSTNKTPTLTGALSPICTDACRYDDLGTISNGNPNDDKLCTQSMCTGETHFDESRLRFGRKGQDARRPFPELTDNEHVLNASSKGTNNIHKDADRLQKGDRQLETRKPFAKIRGDTEEGVQLHMAVVPIPDPFNKMIQQEPDVNEVIPNRCLCHGVDRPVAINNEGETRVPKVKTIYTHLNKQEDPGNRVKRSDESKPISLRNAKRTVAIKCNTSHPTHTTLTPKIFESDRPNISNMHAYTSMKEVARQSLCSALLSIRTGEYKNLFESFGVEFHKVSDDGIFCTMPKFKDSYQIMINVLVVLNHFLLAKLQSVELVPGIVIQNPDDIDIKLEFVGKH